MDARSKRLSLGERLAHEAVYGTILSLPSPEVAEAMALAGFDWLFIDLEHGTMGILECQRMIQAVGGHAESLVRVPEFTESAIKKVLDTGAGGIIVPKVNTAKEAEKAVAYSKYPPEGQRGVGATRAHGYGIHFNDYVTRANQELMVVIQIEHIDGVENIEQIVDVPGVDVIFIGPYDLSASMGLMGQLDHPRVLEAIERVEKVCKDKGIHLGYFGMTAESVQPYIEKGYRLITCGTDTGFLIEGAGKTLSGLRS
ncbi:MAG: 2,4-dihydroxyhept-2-ene-1,7-dioic acid aldolase [Roseivirga sp.]|nr:2,4-dihydroxyhept-2-ene-1,7-dioic acid aldolase [Roseivirga sp.]